MITKDMRKSEIEEFLKGKGDFVQIDHLTRFLQQTPNSDTKKFVYLKLADLYEKRNMYIEAAKMFDFAAIAAVIFSEKIGYHIKETELYIKAGEFYRADEAMKKAVAEATPRDRENIILQIKDFYKRQALVYEKENRRNNASKIYEKLLEMKISDEERQQIKVKLMGLYEQLGKVKEYLTLKNAADKRN